MYKLLNFVYFSIKQMQSNNNVSYNVYTGIWANDITDVFTCNEAIARNATFENWCIFDTLKDAFDHCEVDDLCRGFVVEENKHQIVRKPVVPSTTNGTFYEKDSFIEKETKDSSGCYKSKVVVVLLFLLVGNL
jgi:hypothetical protein